MCGPPTAGCDGERGRRAEARDRGEERAAEPAWAQKPVLPKPRQLALAKAPERAQQVKAGAARSRGCGLAERGSSGRVDAALVAPARTAVAAADAVQAKAAAGAFSYPRVNDVPFPKSSVTVGTDGKKVYSVEYTSQADAPKAILKDVADVVRVAAQDVGLSVARYDVKAMYGTRELRVVAPATSAISLTRGLITREQFLETSTVTLDGSPLSPSYR